MIIIIYICEKYLFMINRTPGEEILEEYLSDYIAATGEFPTDKQKQYYEAGFMQGYMAAVKHLNDTIKLIQNGSECNN